MLLSEAEESLCRKLNIEYSDISNNQLFSDADLEEWINFGILKAWDYKPWPFTVGTKTVTTIDTDYYDQPDALMLGSISKLVVGGKQFEEPLRFEDYLKYKEDYPTGTDKKWSMHDSFLFVNKLAYSIGDAMDMMGKKIPPYLTTASDLLPFSPTADNKEHSGNAAIVLFAYAEALASEKLKRAADSELQEKKAYRILDTLWKPFGSNQAFQQSAKPMFNIPDYFGKNKPSIGNF